MRGTMVTNLTHFLDELGGIAPPRGPARRLAEFFTQIVATVTSDLDEPLGSIPCRRRPGRKPCPGKVDAFFTADDEILWECLHCHDHGVITHWQDTFWDLMDAPTASSSG